MLDGAHLSRCIEVRNSAQVHLTEISLRNGRAVDAPGGCALVNGSGSELTLDGGGVVDCEALWDAFVPDRVTIHGGPYGKFAEAGGGGVAVGAGAVSAVSSGLGRERTSAANGLAEVEARCFLTRGASGLALDFSPSRWTR